MRKLTIAAVAAIAALTAAAGVVRAGADRVAFPDGIRRATSSMA